MQFLLVFVALYVGAVHSWDVATTSGDDTIKFYTNEILTSTIRIASRKISALTYDEGHNMILYVDKQDNNNSICGYDLTCKENKCFTQGSGRQIHDLAFDPVTQKVFFTDTKERNINMISLKRGSKNENKVDVLFKMYDGIPRDIVVDSCDGYIYWLNTNLTTPTIERARLNGYERQVYQNLTAINANASLKFEPSSLAIDQPTRLLYWLEPVSTTIYKMFTSELNKAEKTKASVLTDIYPLFKEDPANTLTISKKIVFRLHHHYGVVRSYSKDFQEIHNKYVYSDKKMPISMVANYEIKDQIHGCEALGQVEIVRECDGPYCVHGMKANDQSACKCAPGYTGERCDVSVCENFCLRGACSVNVEGLPECSCESGYSGERCHMSVCDNFCSRGYCSVNEDGFPVCSCEAGYSGERCYISICENFCFSGNCSVNEEGLPVCRCDAGYAGERCEVNACQRYCLNDGECSLTEEDEPFCQCAEGYQGVRCETAVHNETMNILVSQGDTATKFSCVRTI